MQFDYIVAGAGLSGSVIARRMAEKGKKVLVVERRKHLAGNLYDEMDATGIRVQKYGPHTFHTNDEEVFRFVERFADWKPYTLRCEVNMLGISTPSPFNFKTIDQFFPQQKADAVKDRLLRLFPGRESVTILELMESGDQLVREYSAFLFENDYRPYTAKQWGLKPEEVDHSVLRRVPVRLDYRDSYFTDKYESIPAEGFSGFIGNMLSHPLITIVHDDIRNRIELRDAGHRILFRATPATEECRLVYTGPLDELFGYRYGLLPYRSLRFEETTLGEDSFQPAAIVAWPQKEHFTRITEYKKLPVQEIPGVTLIVKEYPLAYRVGGDEEPYYPVPTADSALQYAKYLEEARRYGNLYLCGRLADFKYYNMDQAVRRALDLSNTL